MTDEGERFSASDLEPDQEEQRALLRDRVQRVATTVAVVFAGIWIGGMIALGACAAPFVFRLTPAPFSGNAMGAAFARFDQIALFASVVILAAEIARTWANGPARPTAWSRLRRVVAILMAMGAAYAGLVLTPRINAMHLAGVSRNVGEEGAVLERVHARAEAIGKAQVAAGICLIALHVFTLRARRSEDEDEDERDAPAPLPPGPAH